MRENNKIKVLMVVVPLVIVSLISGAASVGDVGRLGRMAGKTLIYYFLTTAVAIIIGLVLGNLFQPGAGLNLAQDVASVKVSTPPSMVTFPPSLPMAKAWFAPFPPGINSNPWAKMVSPTTGIWERFVTKSIFILPRTKMCFTITAPLSSC